MSERDKSRDGCWNRLESFLLSNILIRPLWEAVNGTKWLGDLANKFIINRAVLKTKPRPHQFSALADYTSWSSLTDRSWSGRHLGPVVNEGHPDINDVLALFQMPEGGSQTMSEKSTLLFASFAQWFTDGFLMTDNDNRRKNKSNHQIDLNPLYGLTPDVTDQLRLKSEEKDLKGRLKSIVHNGEEFAHTLFEPDTLNRKAEFSAVPEPLNMRRQKDLPFTQTNTIFAFGGDRANTTPITSALNTLFLREHNKVAGIIETANPSWDDGRVFETARNVMIVLLIQTVVEDYINHISPYWFKLRANPKVSWRARWNRPNWIAIEFNLLYRWHGFVPENFSFNGRDVPVNKFILDNSLLSSNGLALMIDQASRQKAGALGLFNTVSRLHLVEKRSIEQGRENQLASYNDYREAMKFPRVTRFEQISGDPQVVEGLRKVYGDVDKIEFFVGLFAEESRKRSAVPSLIGRMVALDAFSQALSNPLLSENVFNETTFSPVGMKIIEKTRSLRDIAARNVHPPDDFLVSFDQAKDNTSTN